ncbi:MAG: lipid-binding SYLF domain-containing protein, partial [Pyrinomonadaceae bacterium]
MKIFRRRNFIGALCAALMLCLMSVPAAAQKNGTMSDKFRPKRAKDAARHSNEAAKVLREVMSVPDKAIPRDLLDKSEAVVVCPNVIKAALVVGGQKGDCIISRRTLKRGWGTPVYYNMAGGSFGAQIGGSSTDYVLLLMNDSALKGLMEDKFEIGGEVSAAAGPVGRTASASTNATLDAG